jgi:hypothetical protein
MAKEWLDTAGMTTTSACSNNITIRSLIYQGDYADFKSAVTPFHWKLSSKRALRERKAKEARSTGSLKKSSFTEKA